MFLLNSHSKLMSEGSLLFLGCNEKVEAQEVHWWQVHVHWVEGRQQDSKPHLQMAKPTIVFLVPLCNAVNGQLQEVR
jgi:hypothetical protein